MDINLPSLPKRLKLTDSDDIGTQRDTVKEFSTSDEERVRLIGQELKHMGLISSLAELTRESGIIVESPIVTSLNSCILEGQWDDAIRNIILLNDGMDLENFKEINYLILVRKFIELVQNGNFLEAFVCMRVDIEKRTTQNVREIAALLLIARPCSDVENVENRVELVDIINSMLPSSVALPQYRLRKLLEYAKQHQIDECICHNVELSADDESISLFADHSCSIDSLPNHIVTDLEFPYKVLSCKFSFDGRYLAVGVIDGTLSIFSIDNFNFTRKYLVNCLDNLQITNFSWRFDGKYLLCSTNIRNVDFVMLFDVETGTQQIINFTTYVQEVIWDSNFRSRIIAGGDSGDIMIYDFNRTVLYIIRRFRCVKLCPYQDGLIIIVDTQNRLISFNSATMNIDILIQEEKPIDSIDIDGLKQYVLLNLMPCGITLWNLKSKVKLYTFMLADVGSFNNAGRAGKGLFASGYIENGINYFCIWNYLKNELLIKIHGGSNESAHDFHWNPNNPMMVACDSGSKVLIWGPSLS